MAKEKKPLPIARAAGAGVKLPPTGNMINQAIRTATTPEAAIYLCDGFIALNLGNTKPIQDVVSTLQTNAHDVAAQRRYDERPWEGKPPQSTFQKFQHELAVEAFQLVSEFAQKDITLDFAVSNDTNLLRGYSSKGGALDTKTVGAMDSLFNAWLAENDMICKGGVIYEAMTDNDKEVIANMNKKGEIRIKRDEQGNPVKDEAGNPVGVRADAEKLKRMITDQASGFEHYVRSHNQGKDPEKQVKLTINPRDYPEPQAGPEVVESPEGGAGPGTNA